MSATEKRGNGEKIRKDEGHYSPLTTAAKERHIDAPSSAG